MTCSTIAAIVGAVSIQMGGDTLVLAPHPTALAQVCYYNNATKASKHGEFEVTLGDLTITGHLYVGDAETLTLSIPGHLQAFPADANPAQVADGETVKFLIIYPSS